MDLQRLSVADTADEVATSLPGTPRHPDDDPSDALGTSTSRFSFFEDPAAAMTPLSRSGVDLRLSRSSRNLDGEAARKTSSSAAAAGQGGAAVAAGGPGGGGGGTAATGSSLKRESSTMSRPTAGEFSSDDDDVDYDGTHWGPVADGSTAAGGGASAPANANSWTKMSTDSIQDDTQEHIVLPRGAGSPTDSTQEAVPETLATAVSVFASSTGQGTGLDRLRKATRKIIAVQALANARTRFEKMEQKKVNRFKKVAKKVQLASRFRQTRKNVRRQYNTKYGSSTATMQRTKLSTEFKSLSSLSQASVGAVTRSRLRSASGGRAEIVDKGSQDMHTSPHLTRQRSVSTLSDLPVQFAAPQPALRRRRCCKCCSQCWARSLYMMEEVFASTSGKAIGLIVFAMLQILLGAVLLQIGQAGVSGWRSASFLQSLWESWTYVADPGTHSDEVFPIRRTFSFFITVGGLLFFAVVVGFVVDGIRARMEELKRGKSSVVEEGHYLILGWTDLSFALVRELCLAMESENGGKIVILSERDKTEIEGEIKEHFAVKELLGTRIVCRTGSALLVSDLHKVAASKARSIIILAQSGDPDKADARVLRTVLSLLGMKQKVQGHVVAELRDIDNQGLVEIVGRGMVETVVSHDVIGRLMIKCARQPGLADAFEMFLGFEGDEFYLANWPVLEGLMFGDLYAYFPAAIPVGIRTSDGSVVLNPVETAVIAAGDQVMFLAEDDDMFAPNVPPADVKDTAPPDYTEPKRDTERVLMCGWRRDIDDIIDLLDTLVPPGSELHMINEHSADEREQKFRDGGLDVATLQNLSLVHHVGNPAARKALEALPLNEYSSVLILADERMETDSMHSDSIVLASVLLIRHIQDARRGLIAPMRTKNQSPKAATSGIARSISRRFIDTALKVSGSAGSIDWGHAGSRNSVSSLSAVGGGAGAGAGAGASTGADAVLAAARKLKGLSGRTAVTGDVSTSALLGSSDAAGAAVDAQRAAGYRPRPRMSNISERSDSDEEAEAERRRGSRSSRASDVDRRSERVRRLSRSKNPPMHKGRDSTITGITRSDVRPGTVLDSASDPIGAWSSRLCCELLDLRTRNVVRDNLHIAAMSDYILSTNITSRILAMVAERREVRQLLDELLGPDGQEVKIKSCHHLVRPGESLSFWEVFLRARRYEEILLGYKEKDSPSVVSNPRQKAQKRVWKETDMVIIMTDSGNTRKAGTQVAGGNFAEAAMVNKRNVQDLSVGEVLSISQAAEAEDLNALSRSRTSSPKGDSSVYFRVPPPGEDTGSQARRVVERAVATPSPQSQPRLSNASAGTGASRLPPIVAHLHQSGESKLDPGNHAM